MRRKFTTCKYKMHSSQSLKCFSFSKTQIHGVGFYKTNDVYLYKLRLNITYNTSRQMNQTYHNRFRFVSAVTEIIFCCFFLHFQSNFAFAWVDLYFFSVNFTCNRPGTTLFTMILRFFAVHKIFIANSQCKMNLTIFAFIEMYQKLVWLHIASKWRKKLKKKSRK